MARSEWIEYVCKFCDSVLEPDSFIPPDCECEGYTAAREAWLAEIRSAPDYEPPLEADEYNDKYPQTYLGERLVVNKDSAHKLKLEARKYTDGEGLCVWIPFPPDPNDPDAEEGSGLCWDFTDADATALHELLTEYLGKKHGNT